MWSGSTSKLQEGGFICMKMLSCRVLVHVLGWVLSVLEVFVRISKLARIVKVKAAHAMVTLFDCCSVNEDFGEFSCQSR